MKKLIFIIFILPLVFGCKEVTEETTTTTVVANPSSHDYVVLSGLSEKGPCNKDTDVLAFPLYEGFGQTGAHFLGSTKTNLGYWEIPAEITETYIETNQEGLCFDERYGGDGIQKLKAIINKDGDRNINPLTTISVDVIRWVYGNQAIKDEAQAIIDAELLVSNVFGFGAMNPFSSISLGDGDINAAKLAVASSVILQAREDQSDFMIEISQAIINENTTAIELELAQNIAILPILTVNNHLQTKYESLGAVWTYPPMHEAAGFPDYYNDLLARTPSVLFELHIDSSTSSSFDTDGYKWFYIPYIFTQELIDSKYAAFNISGDYLSIYSNKFDVYDLPDSEVFVIEKLKENILDGPTGYQGIIENSGVTAGDKMWLVIRSDNPYRLSKASDGPLVSHGRVLASIDGVNLIGMDNDTPYFRRQGLVVRSFD